MQKAKVEECPHRKMERKPVGRDLQETLHPDVYMIFGDCVECGTTLTIGYRIRGTEYSKHSPELIRYAVELSNAGVIASLPMEEEVAPASLE